MSDIKTSVLYVSGEPAMVMLDYLISNGNETRYVFSRLSGGRDEFGHVGWHIIDDIITWSYRSCPRPNRMWEYATNNYVSKVVFCNISIAALPILSL